MKLIGTNTSIENILWSGLTIIFYVKHNTGNEFSYTVSYDITKNQYIRYCVEFLADTINFATVSQVLNFIQCEPETIVSIELEIVN